MTAKDDFRKAWHHLLKAQELTKRHLHRHLYPIVYEDFTYLSDTLNQLATEGAIQPEPKPGQNVAASRSK